MSTSVSVIPDGTKRFKSGGVDDAVAEGPSSKKQKIANNNAETLKKKMLQHESIAKAKKVLAAMSSNTTAVYPDNIDEMYCEFMTLKIMNEDYDASKAQLSPGGTVDQFWHIHVLDTAGYASFFWGINDGDVVHHDALKIFDSDELIGERQEKTRSVSHGIYVYLLI